MDSLTSELVELQLQSCARAQSWLPCPACTSMYLSQYPSLQIIRNKASNASEGYGFVEFSTHAAAEDVLRTLNATPIPNTDQTFRLNWAAFGVGKQTQEGGRLAASGTYALPVGGWV